MSEPSPDRMPRDPDPMAYPKVHMTVSEPLCAACGKPHVTVDANGTSVGTPDTSGVGRDTAGAVKAIHFACEVVSGLTLHANIPIKLVSELEQNWPLILQMIKEAAQKVKTEEMEKLTKQLKALQNG